MKLPCRLILQRVRAIPETYPIANTGFRDGAITAITFDDPQFVLDPTSVCQVGVTVTPGESCSIVIKFTPTGGVVHRNMTINYNGAGQDFSKIYPLDGEVH